MGADISRVRFDAGHDYAGVLLQQGRVLLDADWNEQVDIVARRLRAQAADLGSPGLTPGTAGVAVVPRTTPDAFALTPLSNDLEIGSGRAYVDGILVESHGDPDSAQTWDPLLDDTVGADPSRYLKQPWWPTPTALPTSGAHVVYLDVWERELTALERPDLVEPAVGVDSTARRQVVWQLRVLADDATGVDCSTKDADVPGWAALTKPSAGRLTTDTIDVPPTVDPCVLPPTGGYRGLENQTYRVEIHDGGGPGTATFCWSRDNASIASAVLEHVGSSQIRPASMGRDDVLRFEQDQWVEILDDHRELNRQPGEIRRVTSTDDGLLTLDQPLPADLLLDADHCASQHLRVRRWDQTMPAGSSGVVTVPAGGAAVELEHGITVSLTSPGGAFDVGDYWVFAARTADTSVEKLDAAPPFGVHHHYARLGVATFTASSIDVTDCRTLWPRPTLGGDSCGDCTVCVTPESHADGTLTIQDAVDLVTPTGGTVCLAAGSYAITEPVVVTAVSVTIRGQGYASKLVCSGDAGIQVVSSAQVTLERFAMLTDGRSGVLVDSSQLVTLDALVLFQTLQTGEDPAVPAIGFRGTTLMTVVRDCIVTSQIGVGEVRRTDDGPAHVSGLVVQGSWLDCPQSCLTFGPDVLHTMHNGVYGSQLSESAEGCISALGSVAPGASFDIRDNTVSPGGPGVLVGANGYTVEGNEVLGDEGLATDPAAHGIVVSADAANRVPGAVRFASNTVRDMGGTALGCLAPVSDWQVADNVVTHTGDGIVLPDQAKADTVSIHDNTLTDVGHNESDTLGHVGVWINHVGTVDVRDNVIDTVGAPEPDDQAIGVVGVGVIDAGEIEVAGNTIASVGSLQGTIPLYGIGAVSFGNALVHANSVRWSPDEEGNSELAVFGLHVVSSPSDELRTHGNVVLTYASKSYVIGPRTLSTSGDRGDSGTVVHGNSIDGVSADGVGIFVEVPGHVTVSDNQVRTALKDHPAGISLVGRTAAVHSNRVRTNGAALGLLTTGSTSTTTYTVLGNVVSNEITVGGNPLGAPWAELNVIA